METFALVTASGALLWIVYWAILRPTLMSVIGDELHAAKVRMDWAIIEGLPEAQSESAQQFDFVLTKGAGLHHFITFGQLVATSYINRKNISLRRDEWRKKFEESPVWLRDAQREWASIWVKAALLNSPLWWPVLPFILFLTLLSKKVANWWQDIQAAQADVVKKNASNFKKLAPC